MALKFVRNSSQRPYRVAIVVSRKVHKSAVVRNRIRRRLYEAVRQAEVAIEPGTDLVFTVFSEQVAGLEAPRLQAMVAGLLQKTASHDVLHPLDTGHS